MKDILRSVLAFTLKAIILLVLIGLFVFAGNYLLVRPLVRTMESPLTLNVDGTAKRSVVPDLAEVSVGAYFTGTNAAQIRQSADAALNTTRAELLTLGIAESKIQSNYSITPKYDRDYLNITGYTAHATMLVKTKDFTQVDDILNSAQNHGLILVDGVSFTLEDPVAARQQLREQAIAAARTKAETMATQAGLSLGRVVNISEGYTPSYYPYYNNLRLNSVAEAMPSGTQAADSSAITPGETEIQMTITLTYEVN